MKNIENRKKGICGIYPITTKSLNIHTRKWEKTKEVDAKITAQLTSFDKGGDLVINCYIEQAINMNGKRYRLPTLLLSIPKPLLARLLYIVRKIRPIQFNDKNKGFWINPKYIYLLNKHNKLRRFEKDAKK